jgi:lipopolysaccharide assembly outer membrane protein LptD (OstA)
MIKKYFFCTVCLFASASFALAQTSEPQKEKVEILGTNTIERNPEISDASRLLGNVRLGMGDVVLSCDSAYRFNDGTFEVFSNVRVRQEGDTELTADYAILDPNTATITVRTDVEFRSEDLVLVCNELYYDLESKLVSYYSRATIVDGERTLESNLGTYSSSTQMLYAGGNVIIEEGLDFIASDSLALDRGNSTLYLFQRSHLDVGGALINCGRGVFAGETEEGWFADNASVFDHSGYLAGDSIVVARQAGEGTAWGNVVVRDSSKALTVTGSYANRKDDVEIILGDSIVPAIAMNVENSDTLILGAVKLRKDGDWLYAIDEVEFEQAEFSGEGDSLSWDLNTDEVWLLGNPVVRSIKEELIGDSVRMIIVDNMPSVLSLLGHAKVLSVANDSLKNEIKGKTLDAQFRDGELFQVDIHGNGNVLYYTVDDPENISENKATCSHIRMLFREGEVSSITLLTSPEGSVKNLD